MKERQAALFACYKDGTLLLDGFPAEPLESKLKILAALRSQGFFPALPAKK